jgi:hypothetical protein
MKKLTYKARKETDTAPLKIQGRVVMEHDITTLKKGNYRITIEAWRNKASHSQFKWLYGSVYPLALIALNDAGYEFTDVDQVDLFFKTLYAGKEVLNRETGEIVTIPCSKSEFLTVDHMAYTEQIRTHCSEYLNASIPDPDVDWKKHKLEMIEAIKKEVQNKINANKL